MSAKRRLTLPRLQSDEMAPDIHAEVHPEELYRALDPGIRFAVRVLNAAGIKTCQSCQGGDGHSYPEPTVDFLADNGIRDAIGFSALEPLVAYGLPVRNLSLVWNLDEHGYPHERLWRVTFATAMHERANEKPMFVWGYMTGRA